MTKTKVRIMIMSRGKRKVGRCSGGRPYRGKGTFFTCYAQNILFLSLSIKYMVVYLIIFETLNICFIPVSIGRIHLIENETPRG